MSRARFLSTDSDWLGDLIEQLAQAEEALGAPGGDQGGVMPGLLRQARSELLVSRAGWRLLLEHAPLVVWSTDAQLRLTSLLGSGLEAFKLRPDQLLGVGLEEVLDQKPQAGTILEAHRRALAGETVTYEIEALGRTYQAALEPLREDGGPPTGCMGIALDVTQRREGGAELDQLSQAHEELRVYTEELQVQQEELHQQNSELMAARGEVEAERLRYRELFEFAPDGYLATDPSGVIRQANRAAAALLGVSQDFLAGKPLAVYLSREEQAGWYQCLEELEGGKGRVQVQMRVRPRRGDAFPAVITLGSMRDRSGALAGLRCMLRDVSGQVRLEEERERLLEQVSRDRESLRDLAGLLERERDSLKTIMESTPTHLALLDQDFNFIRVNAAYARGAGHGQQELIGRNHFDLFPDAENQAIFERVRDTGEPAAFQARPFEYLDQSERGITYWDWTLVPVRDEGGGVRTLVLSLLDVTERERVGQAVQRYAERLRILHQADQSILAASTAEQIAFVTLPYVRRLMSCQRASVTLFDFEADQAWILAVEPDGDSRLSVGTRLPLGVWPLETLAQGRIHGVAELRDKPSSGLNQALLAQGLAAYVNVPLTVAGKLVGSLNLGWAGAVSLDQEQTDVAREVADELAIGIQQARLHEQVARYADELEELVARRTAALRTSQERFRVMFEAAGLGIALDDLQGHILESNPALQDMLGYPAEELRGMAYSEFTHPEDLAAEEILFRELAGGARDRYRIAKRYVRKDGALLWANLTVSLVRGAEDEPRFAIAMVEDITEQRRIQEALVRSEKLAVAGRLAASLAHEINNPLQSVIGCLGLAQEALEEGQRLDRYLDVASGELGRIARIVAQLRDLGRPSGSTERMPVDLKTLIESMVTLNRARCQSRAVEVVWQAGDGLPELYLVADQIQQVFLNMLLNALDAMPDGGRLEIAAMSTDEPPGVQVSFRDSGLGIPPESLPHVFEPFYSTRPDGMGLGLFISHNVVQDHGGTIEVESQPGQGTTFTVWLPPT
jgi:PAS domain S-box-containing protein